MKGNNCICRHPEAKGGYRADWNHGGRSEPVPKWEKGDRTARGCRGLCSKRYEGSYSLAKQKLMGKKIGKKSAPPSGVSDQEKPGTEKSHLGAALWHKPETLQAQFGFPPSSTACLQDSPPCKWNDQYGKASSETPEAGSGLLHTQGCFTWGRKHQLNQLKNLFLCKFESRPYSKSSNNTRWQVPAIWTEVSVSIFLSWRFKIKWHRSFFPIIWRRVCVSTGLAGHSSPFWWDKQRFCLKMSLRYLQRNNLITSRTPKCWIWAVIKRYPNQTGINKGEITTTTMAKPKCHPYRDHTLFHFTRDTASRQQLKHKTWKCDLHKGESLKNSRRRER